jgi:3-mercaptopyruvate sulfurtransferase SseA
MRQVQKCQESGELEAVQVLRPQNVTKKMNEKKVGPLVTSVWLNENRDRCVVLEACWASDASYLRGHIPGAVFLDTDSLETPSPMWYLCPEEELCRVLGDHGVGEAEFVCIYGSTETIAAARVWWICQMIGSASTPLILDGGAKAWKRSGFALETAANPPKKARFVTRGVRRDMLASLADVRSGLFTIADCRSRAEFCGQTSGYVYLQEKGRIPGSIFVEDAAGPSYQNEDGTLVDPDEVQSLWNARGIGDERKVVFCCGSGWRSSLCCLFATILNMEAANYSDGWSGYSTVFEKIGEEWTQRKSGYPVVVDPVDE